MLDKGMYKEDILSQKSQQYCIFQNNIICLQKFNHPGGNYIIKKINSREIDSYIFGGYSLEDSQRKPHVHSKLALTWLQNHIIKSLPKQSVFIKPDQINKSQINQKNNQFNTTSKNSKLLFQNLLEKSNINKQEYQSKIIGQEIVSPTTLKFIFDIIVDNEMSYFVKNINFGLNWMGKHYILQQQGLPTQRLYTNVICYTQENIQIRAKLFELINNDFVKDFNVYQDFNQYSKGLPLIIKDYQHAKAFSTQLNKIDQNITRFNIKGLHGLGLQIQENTQGLHVAFTGGTGILPFLDLLDYLLRKSIYMVGLQINGQEWADKVLDPYQLGYQKNLNKFKFQLYASYNEIPEFLGRDIIEPLYLLNQKYDLNIFDVFLRFSEKSYIQGMKVYTDSSNKIVGKYDEKFIEKQLYEIEEEGIEKVWVCGPPEMQRQIPEILEKFITPNKINFI